MPKTPEVKNNGYADLAEDLLSTQAMQACVERRAYIFRLWHVL